MIRISAALAVLVILSAALVPGPASHAQYAPPVGSLEASTSSTNPETGSDATLACELKDPSGAPIAGEDCTFAIVSEPGTDAALGSKSVTRVTDANGRATTPLYVGTTPGVILISVTAGALSSSILVTVSGDGPLPPAAPITAPSTGNAGLAR